MSIQPISPQAFVERMARHWTETLGNVVSEPLRAAWLQMATEFRRHILAHGDPARGTEWTVLQPATGSGKSQGTAVYCAMLSSVASAWEHPGVLIVTRRIEDADTMAETINGLAGQEDYARAYHSAAAGDGVLGRLREHPVLVITHRAYGLALDALGQEGTVRRTWPFFHGWGAGERRLVIVDEALDIVEESRGELEGLRLTLASIPQRIRDQHVGAIDAIKAVIEILETMGASTANSGAGISEAILLRQRIDAGTVPDMTALRADLRSVRFDWQLRKSDQDLSRSQRAVHDDRLRQLDMIFRSWVYYAKVPGHGHTLNTARLLVPEEVKGAVVLDATATSNLIYQLFEHARVLPPPEGVRNYRNVTLHVSRGHKVGKVSMRKEGDQLVSAVFDDLRGRLSPNRSVFAIGHEETEPKVLLQEAPFEVRAGHWNAITGSNAWRDCDVAVVIGLPYRPDTWTANTFMALQGVQTTEWLRSNRRPFGDHEDIRGAIKRGQVVSDLAQAINRIRCRKVIDAEGNCPAADVYLLLPNGPEGNDILAGLVKLMVGIKVQPWTLAGAPSAAKRGRKAGTNGIRRQVAAAHAYLKAAMPGKTSKRELTSALHLSAKAWDALVASAADLLALGIDYRVEGVGRGARSYFHKH
jgi:hypothetical protein